MNRATFIETLTEVQQTVGQLLTQLQASEADKFVAHLYHVRMQYRLGCERRTKDTGQSNARLYPASGLSKAQSLGGDCRAWKHLLRIRE